MRPRWFGTVAAAAALVLWLALPAAAEPLPDIVLGGEVHDVTGAGVLDLGNVQEVLRPFWRDFAKGAETLAIEVTVDADGVVQDCRADQPMRLAAAGEAVCAEARRAGRFRRFDVIQLDYTRARYRVNIRKLAKRPAKDRPGFSIKPGFPYYFRSISFSGYTVPPAGERLSFADLDYLPMDYPAEALQDEIEAEVVVAVTFDGRGRVASCRPIWSSNTARMAYETCLAAQRGFSLRRPPDMRPFVWRTAWLME